MRVECGISNNGPVTTVSQQGMFEKIVKWVADSYRDIQLRYPNWRWMRAPFSVNTVAADDTYAYGECTDTQTALAISRFASWWAHDRIDRFKINLTSAGVSSQNWMLYLPYENFKYIYKFGVQQGQPGQPIYVAVDDNDQIIIGPVPNGIYTITGSYQRGPQILAADGDTPDLPSRYHDLIVYYAMERYATNSIAPEVLARAIREGARMMRSLEQSQLPQMKFARAMA